MMNWSATIVNFWFEELKPKDWWIKSDSVDNQIKERFFELWEEQKTKIADDFMGSPEIALAAIILFDQFPRNMFRGLSEAFASDHLALQIAEQAVDMGLDKTLSDAQRSFLYMPFMHSEDLDDQNRSVTLFTALGSNIKFANSHRDAITKFGRFPGRNMALGRAMRAGEQAAVDGGANW
jgi:uncharacterized protein (DUF924 family)